MDFGIGFLSNNVMLPILDFFYGVVPSYGLAIVALTLVIRLALYPLSAGSIRTMRRTRVTSPIVQKRQKEIQQRYKDDPAKQQEELSKIWKEFGNPLAGCLPAVLQMPILFALFATLRGSPFADVTYTINLQILPKEQIEQVQPQSFSTAPQNVYVSDGVHAPVLAVVPSGDRLAVGETTRVEFRSDDGRSLAELLADRASDSSTSLVPAEDAARTSDGSSSLAVADGQSAKLEPQWKVTRGEERVHLEPDGTIVALSPGEVTLEGRIPGLASNKGFLFIEALGRVGAFGEDGAIHWDVIVMILFFGISLYVSQMLSSQGTGSGNSQQDTVNKVTPVIFSGMFLFFPLPAGVLMYMVIANIFQTLQTFILSREPLPENIQKLLDAESKTVDVKASSAKDKDGGKKAKQSDGRQVLPFEPKSSSKNKA